MSTRKESRRMKKKYWTTRMLSGVLSAVMVVSVAIIPMTASVAASPRKDDDIGEYVASLPDLEDVRDKLDASEAESGEKSDEREDNPLSRQEHEAKQNENLSKIIIPTGRL